MASPSPPSATDTPDLFVFSATTQDDLAARLEDLRSRAQSEARDPGARLADLAAPFTSAPPLPQRLALLAQNHEDFIKKATHVLAHLSSKEARRLHLGNAVFYSGAAEHDLSRKTAFLFPGYGAQEAATLDELYTRVPAVRRFFEALPPDLGERFRKNPLLFRPRRRATSTRQRAAGLGYILDSVLIANAVVYALLRDAGARCDVMAGHSYGEHSALAASGMVRDERQVYDLLQRLAEHVERASLDRASSAMLAVSSASRKALAELWSRGPHPAFIVIDNCPEQAILCGPPEVIADIEQQIRARGETAFRLPELTHPVHTPRFPVSSEDLVALYRAISLERPSTTVYGCSIAAPFPDDLDAVRACFAEQWRAPVRFRETVERLYADGVRTFVEVGPGGRLSGFVRDTLRGTDARAIPSLPGARSAVTEIQLCLAQLFVRGHDVDLSKFVIERAPQAAPALRAEARRTPNWDSTASRWEAARLSRANLETMSGEERRRALLAHILSLVVELLDLPDGAPVDTRQGFFALGMGSLEAVRLAERLRSNLSCPLAPTAPFDHPTPERLADHIAELLGGERPAAAEEEAASRASRVPVEGAAREPIAIVGMGCRFPGGATTPRAFWALLDRGGDAITDVPPNRWVPEELYAAGYVPDGEPRVRRGGFLGDVYGFDAEFFGITPREALTLDPQQRLLLEVTWEALEDAGQDPERLAGSATGVFIGIGSADYAQRLSMEERIGAGGYIATGNLSSTAAGRISYVLGLTGPCLAVDTACSSSLVAVHLACESLRRGESDLALAGGVNLLLSPEMTTYLALGKALSPDGRCKTFDASADGYVRAEGCGVIVLKRLGDAIAAKDEILAVLRGSAMNHDGRTSGLTVPSGPSQAALIRAALASGGVDPRHVDYIEAHGTGTSLGDPIELRAIGQALGGGRTADDPLLVGAVKTNIGHLEAAAGIAGLIKVVLQLRHRQITASLHFETPNPRVDWDALPVEVCARPRPWPARAQNHPPTAGVSSFGISGTNAHVIVEAAPDASRPAGGLAPWTHHLLTLSAKSEPALRALAAGLADHLEAHATPDAALADTCYTTNTGRARLDHRAAFVVESAADAVEALRARAAMDSKGTPRTGARPRVAFLFTGQGAQGQDMGRDLYASDPIFRDTLDQCGSILRGQLPVPLLDVLYPPSGAATGRLIDRTEYAQPALFAVEYALAQTLLARRILPGALLGHSIGEYVAACVADVLSLEDALRLVATRGRLMQSLPEDGAMLATNAPTWRLKKMLDLPGLNLSFAADNGPSNVVLSGPRAGIRAAAGQLTSLGVRATELNVSHAFHSVLMDPILDAFRRAVEGVPLAPPRIPLVSTYTGAPVSDEMLDPEYFVKQLRATVEFAEAMESLDDLGFDTFVEVGPRPVLIGLGPECVTKGAQRWLACLRPPVPDRRQLLQTIAALYEQGVDIDFARLHDGQPRARTELPPYPFQREPYCLPYRSIDRARRSAASASTHAEPGDALTAPVTRGDARAEAADPMASARESYRVAFNAASPSEHHKVILDHIQGAAAYLMGLPRGRTPDAHRPLNKMGIDSMMAAQLRAVIGAVLDVDVSLVTILDGATLDGLAERVLRETQAKAAAEPATGGTDWVAGEL